MKHGQHRRSTLLATALLVTAAMYAGCVERSATGASEEQAGEGSAVQPPEQPAADAPVVSRTTIEAPVFTETEITESVEAEIDAGPNYSAADRHAWNSAIGLGGGAGRRVGGSRATHEEYQRISEHDWTDPRSVPLSTFAVDVDGGSWSNVRRFIENGGLPPRDAVRVEECVNWFRYESPTSADVVGEHPLAVATETFPCPWRPEHRLLRVALHAPPIEQRLVPPCNLVFLVDVSGSMRNQDKLPLLKRGLLLLARQMRPQDKVAIVTYAGSSAIHLQSTAGSERQVIEEAIHALSSGGSTHGSAGIRDAYRLARESMDAETVDRVLLATDGDFNVGVTDREELIALIEQQKELGVFLTVLGFGTGNLKEATLEQLANTGNGQYAYIDSIAEARRVLVEQMGSTLVTVAKDAKVQIEFNPAFVSRYRQVGYENRKLAAEDFNDDRKDGGEIGAGHHVTALYEIVPVGVEPPTPAVDALRYQDESGAPEAMPETEASETELALVKVRYKHPDADTSERFDTAVLADAAGSGSRDGRRAAAVAAFAMLLRQSSHLPAEFGYDGLFELLDEVGDGADPHGDWSALRRLASMARDLAATEPSQR